MQALPIDEVLPDLLACLAKEPRAVLEAPPGAGKTTRVPWAIACAPWCSGRVIVSEPRRIAARLAARRASEEYKQRLGGRIGYRVRFEDVTSPETRVIYLTEGILLRQLISDPKLDGIDCVILDELHERSLDVDVCLALLEQLQRTRRPKLRILVMSATLDGAHLAAYLHDCRRLTSEGRTFPVEVHHLAQADVRPLEKQVRSATREAFQRGGNVLVFLPGAADIRRAAQALDELAEDFEVVPLHGDLPIEAQARAVSPSSKRRVVLATNVAESSVTIPDIETVIDSGLARVARHSPFSGIQGLELQEISQARAIQRVGRAGRTSAGRAIRLYTAGNFSARPRQDASAIEREDLSSALLSLLARGTETLSNLRWLTPPPASAWNGAQALLETLGALGDGQLTEIGQRLLDFPLHPRLARLIVEGERIGHAEGACLAAALLSERDIRRALRTHFGAGSRVGSETGDSDVMDRMDRFNEARDLGFSRQAAAGLDLDLAAARAVERSYRQLVRLARTEREPSSDETNALGRCLLAAFSDRVAQRRGQSSTLLLCGGTTAQLSETSVVQRDPWLVALVADQTQGKRGQALVRMASRIEPEWLLDHYSERLTLEETLDFDASGDRLERTTRLRYGKLILDESRTRATPGPEASELLIKSASAKGLAVSDPEGTLTQLEVRLRLLHQRGLLDIEPDALDVRKQGIQLGAGQVTSLSELGALQLGRLVLSTLPPSVRHALDEYAPLTVRLPSGRALSVHYEPGKTPWIESRLQDFFGLRKTPAICRGMLPLQLHLLAPNRRAVQVTTDLVGFWERHYPSIRKELMRRYPRHPWPEDGQSATPPVAGRR